MANIFYFYLLTSSSVIAKVHLEIRHPLPSAACRFVFGTCASFILFYLFFLHIRISHFHQHKNNLYMMDINSTRIYES